MMSTKSMTLPTTGQTGQPCSSCGAPTATAICCQLDCLEQPRFFCGQLLTDQDLMQLLHWTQDKLRLVRYRQGWGVVCGLEVRCDPKQEGQVIVGPGYAVSCCGDDLIVCKDTSCDLSAAWVQPEEQCQELRQPNTEPVPIAVDLYLRYKEEPFNPQTALGRSVCREVEQCEYSRIRETGEPYWQRAPTGANEDPVTAAANSWQLGYKKSLSTLINQLQGEVFNFTNKKIVNQQLLNWFNDNPPRLFSFLIDLLKADLLDASVTQLPILFLLLQERRGALLACACQAWQQCQDVPLARIILLRRRANGGRRSSCRILSIDAYPPYRRPLRQDCWPAPTGQVNVGQVILHRVKEARAKLAALGLRQQFEEEVSVPSSINALEAMIQSENLFVDSGQDIVLQTLDLGEVDLIKNAQLSPGKRVVGFEMSSPVARSNTGRRRAAP